jgi:ketosteroid isomerase-like protein
LTAVSHCAKTDYELGAWRSEQGRARLLGEGILTAVSQQNVEIVRSAVDAFNQRDVSAAFDLFHPKAELDWSERLLDPTVPRGREGLQQFLEEMFEIFGEVQFEEEEIIDLGEEVVWVGIGRFQGKQSGAEVAARAANVWTVRDGKIVRFQFHQDKESALQAAGSPDRAAGP